MRISIRSKFTLFITFFMVVIFTIMGFLSLREERARMTGDIYRNNLAFAQMIGPEIIELHDLYFDSSVIFNSKISEILDTNPNISGLELINYKGNSVYNSLYEAVDAGGNKPIIHEFNPDQLYSESVMLELENYELINVDEDEFLPSRPIHSLMIPVDEMYSVLFYFDYSELNSVLLDNALRVMYLALFGILLGIFLAKYLSKRFTKPLAKLVVGAEQIATGDYSSRVFVNSNDEIQDLSETFNRMAHEIQQSMQAKLYKERVTAELALATEIQTSLVPRVIPAVRGIDMAAGLIPAEEIGGDIYDFLKLSDDQMLMYLGDVTGHGVPAGIVSSVANALFYGFGRDMNLKKILIEVNRVMKSKVMATMFMTLCLMKWDALKNEFSYASAGHEQILHYKAATKKVELLPAGGVALAMVADIGPLIKEVVVDFQPGDFLVIYSDGIPEMWRSPTEVYGMERFMKAVESFGDLDSALAIKEAILADVEQFAGGYKRMDDVTVMVIKHK